MYVTRMLLCAVGAEVTNTPLNHSVVFVKENDMFLNFLEKQARRLKGIFT